MDEATLLIWKSQLETDLSVLESKISSLEIEKGKIREQLGAVMKLLSSINGGDHTPSTNLRQPTNKFLSSEEATMGFISNLKLKGWSINHNRGRAKIYDVSRGDQSAVVWPKFSKYSEAADHYWFGIEPEGLKNLSNKRGGVILLLGQSEIYLSIPFPKLIDILDGAHIASDGNYKFHVREKDGAYLFQAAGKDPIDVSSFFNALSEIGLG